MLLLSSSTPRPKPTGAGGLSRAMNMKGFVVHKTPFDQRLSATMILIDATDDLRKVLDVLFFPEQYTTKQRLEEVRAMKDDDFIRMCQADNGKFRMPIYMIFSLEIEEVVFPSNAYS